MDPGFRRGYVAPDTAPRCPRCHALLAAREQIERCDLCLGAFVAPPVMSALFDRPALRSSLALVRGSLALPDLPGRLAPRLQCPRCLATMPRYGYAGDGPTVDACAEHGLWLDRGELGTLVMLLDRLGDLRLPQGPEGDRAALLGTGFTVRRARLRGGLEVDGFEILLVALFVVATFVA